MSAFETHLTAVMDTLIRASVCEISKLFQETVNDYLVELSLNRKENEALKLRLKLTESKLRTERKYGMGWAASRRNAGLNAGEEVGGRQKRKVDVARKYFDVEWLKTLPQPFSDSHVCHFHQRCICVCVSKVKKALILLCRH